MRPLVCFGEVEDKVLAQMRQCLAAEAASIAVLCADNHLGYSMPIGGVIAYREHISPSAIGYDIACGNAAVRTNVQAKDINRAAVMDEIWRTISFGIGRKNPEPVEDAVLDEIAECDHPLQKGLAQLAAQQLGTVGSGNHYVDLFEDADDGALWIGVHFGSRGFGHKTASWGLQLAGHTSNAMDAPPAMLKLGTDAASAYIDGMERAGRYAYAGRDWVIRRVLKILGAQATDTIHNHHNYAWPERHHGSDWIVHRKGATPAFPGQRGFVGGTMAEPAVILEGVDTMASREALRSTVHGAGRAMSRTQAAGKRCRKTGDLLKPGLIDFVEVRNQMLQQGIELRGAGADEAPAAYKRLDQVLTLHFGTVKILHTLWPIGVAMAGPHEYDPFKD